ncbi:MAG: hypothetical protein HYS13_06125 [Planctomycetia bacterium]|nr:hypothetical protein [Planctomycetia bacterium]
MGRTRTVDDAVAMETSLPLKNERKTPKDDDKGPPMKYTSVHYIMLSAGATGTVKSSYCKQQVPFLE